MNIPDLLLFSLPQHIWIKKGVQNGYECHNDTSQLTNDTKFYIFQIFFFGCPYYSHFTVFQVSSKYFILRDTIYTFMVKIFTFFMMILVTNAD